MSTEHNGRVMGDRQARAYLKDLDFTFMRCHWREVLGSKNI